MNKPKTFLLWGAALAVAGGALSLPSVSSGQAAGDDPAVTNLVTEIADQYVKLAANQQAIEQKIAVVAEQLRIARIYVSRGGGRK